MDNLSGVIIALDIYWGSGHAALDVLCHSRVASVY